MITKFDEFRVNESNTYTVIIEKDEETSADSKNIKLGVSYGNAEYFLPMMDLEDLKMVKDQIDEYLKIAK